MASGEPAVATFGELLRRRRLAAALSQEALAERARLSVEAISLLERGRRAAPRSDTLHLLAEALSLNANERAAFFAAARGQAGAATAPPPASAPAHTLHATTLPPPPLPPTPLLGDARPPRRGTRLAGGPAGTHLPAARRYA